MTTQYPVPFLPQENEFSCTVACLRMVMAYWGVTFERETDLYDCSQTTVTGTHADDAVACARLHGFDAEHVRHIHLKAIQEWLSGGVYPIALINTFPLIAKWSMHSVVVVGVEDSFIHYLDPARGERADNLTAFEQAWQMNRNRIILLQKS